MKRNGFTLIEGVVVVAIIGVVVAILLPVLGPRPARFYAVVIAPQHFRQTPLSVVMARLDQARQTARTKEGKKSFAYLSSAHWSTESLKRRRVSLDTQEEMPLKDVLERLEKTAHIRLNYGGWCGTCGSSMGRLRIEDTLGKLSAQMSGHAK